MTEPNRPALVGTQFHKLDLEYEPFPPFGGWAPPQCDLSTWDQASQDLASTRDQLGPESLRAAVTFTIRAAALDTGALEGLYDVDRGFTFSVAIEAATWQEEIDKRGGDVRRFFEAQLRAYHLVLDAVTNKMPVSEAWLRALHEHICASQDTYKVLTSVGMQEHSFTKGQYKTTPNHVLKPDGTTFSYAPVDRTPPEMKRLLDELKAEPFESAHPIIQASYAHYCLVRIHPFPDGNGRLARALASLYLYRAASLPLLVFADQRDAYFDALLQADGGDHRPFIGFVLQRGLDTISLINEQLKYPQAPPSDVTVGSLRQLYYSRTGMHHFQLDEAAYRLVQLANEAVDKRLAQLKLPPEVAARAIRVREDYGRTNDGYRPPVKEHGLGLQLQLHSKPPAAANLQAHFRVYISQDPDSKSRLLLRSEEGYADFLASVDDAHSNKAQLFHIRLATWAERIVGAALEGLYSQARQSLAESGYAPP